MTELTRVMIMSGEKRKGFYRSCPGVFEKGVKRSEHVEAKYRALVDSDSIY